MFEPIYVPWHMWVPILVLLQGDLNLRGTLYLVLYTRPSKRHHTGGKCITCCGLPALTMQPPNMGRATQITEHAHKTDRQTDRQEYFQCNIPYKKSLLTITIFRVYDLKCVICFNAEVTQQLLVDLNSSQLNPLKPTKFPMGTTH